MFGLPLRQLASHPSVPVEGGCANDYTYGFGDPINEFDLDGLATKCPKQGKSITITKPNGSKLRIDGLGGNRYHVGVVGSYGMSPFIMDTVIIAEGKNANGKRYRNITRSSDKLKARGEYDLWANHLSIPAQKPGSTLKIRAEQPWDQEIWYPVGRYGIAVGDLWLFKCKV